MRTISLERLRDVLDCYGADPAHWPAEEREAGLALLARSSEARRHRDDVAQLDRALDLAHVDPPSAALAARVLAAAQRRDPDRFGWLIALAAPLAAAAGLVSCLVHSSPPASQALDADTIAQLSTYSTPSDALLSDLDVVDATPSVGCTDGGLGCLELRLPSSRRDGGARTRA